MTGPVRRVAFYGYLGSGNIGNDATLETVLAWLHVAHPHVEVRCITIAPAEVSARYGVPSVPLSWGSPGRGGTRFTETARKLLGRLIDVPRGYALVGSVDAVVVPGMGVLEDTLGARTWGLPFWLFVTAAACRLRRRPFVLLDVGAAYAANPVTRRLYVVTAGLATHVSYRDRASQAAMHRAGARGPATVAPDLAFAHPAPTWSQPVPGRIVVGVMAYYGPADDPVRGAHVRRRYVAAMAEAIGRFLEEGDRVVLVGGDPVDMDVARDISTAVRDVDPALADHALTERDVATFTELTDEMRQAEVIIASRFHNLIGALRLARPTVSVGYAAKNRHLMYALDLDDYCQDIDQLDADRLVAQVQAARQNSAALVAQIRRATSQYADQAEALLEHMANEALGLTSQGNVLTADEEMSAWRSA